MSRKKSSSSAFSLQPSAFPKRPTPHLIEAEVATGLEWVARDELHRVLGKDARAEQIVDHSGVVRFTYTGDLRMLAQLRTVQAVYLVRQFPVPRPKALLGDQHFRALVELVAAVRAVTPNAYRTLHIGAAGSDSSVMQRLKDELARAAGLQIGVNEGDLLLRLRRDADGEGWEALVRIGSRPLATRAWRVQNYGGALNATVAHAMALLTNPQPTDMFLNLLCGSGTLLIERCAAGPVQRAVGCDTSSQALAAAQANIEASGYRNRVELSAWDARALPLPDASVDALVADLPFGNLTGSHKRNLMLYPAVLAEAARVAKPGARFVLITHEVRLMDRLLAPQTAWTCERSIMVGLGGLHPRIYVLQRTLSDER
jgi:23S rRNA G2445 N2-methylase RlmL